VVGEILQKFLLAEAVCAVCEERTFEGKIPICQFCLDHLHGDGHYLESKVKGADKAKAFGFYTGVLAKTIRALKFRGVKALAEPLGKGISEDIRRFINQTRAEVITFVPVHFFRWYRRGFDQNEEILKHAGVSALKLLERTRHTPPMAGLGREERLRNVSGSFRIKEGLGLEGKRVLVFDDVVTTGSTATEVARILRDSGAKRVDFYFLAEEY